MSIALFIGFVLLALVGIVLQVRSRGELRPFVIGSVLVVASLPVFAAAWVNR